MGGYPPGDSGPGDSISGQPEDGVSSRGKEFANLVCHVWKGGILSDGYPALGGEKAA